MCNCCCRDNHCVANIEKKMLNDEIEELKEIISLIGGFTPPKKVCEYRYESVQEYERLKRIHDINLEYAIKKIKYTIRENKEKELIKKWKDKFNELSQD